MCICLQMLTIDEYSGTISLFDNGTVKDTKSSESESPFCENKQKMSLLSYNFKIKTKCSNGDKKCRFQEKRLSPKAEMLVHEKCSFKRECDQLNFKSGANEHKNDSLHSLLIYYQCLGKYSHVVFDRKGQYY